MEQVEEMEKEDIELSNQRLMQNTKSLAYADQLSVLIFLYKTEPHTRTKNTRVHKSTIIFFCRSLVAGQKELNAMIFS